MLVALACPSKNSGISPCSANQLLGRTLASLATVRVIAIAGKPQAARHSRSERVATLASLNVSK